MHSGFASIKDGQLYFEEAGFGPALVFIRGFSLAELINIAAPTLAIVGRQYLLHFHLIAALLLERIRGARLRNNECPGPPPNMEQPEAFNLFLQAFLEELG